MQDDETLVVVPFHLGRTWSLNLGSAESLSTNTNLNEALFFLLLLL